MPTYACTTTRLNVLSFRLKHYIGIEFWSYDINYSSYMYAHKLYIMYV